MDLTFNQVNTIPETPAGGGVYFVKDKHAIGVGQTDGSVEYFSGIEDVKDNNKQNPIGKIGNIRAIDEMIGDGTNIWISLTGGYSLLNLKRWVNKDTGKEESSLHLRRIGGDVTYQDCGDWFNIYIDETLENNKTNNTLSCGFGYFDANTGYTEDEVLNGEQNCMTHNGHKYYINNADHKLYCDNDIVEEVSDNT